MALTINASSLVTKRFLTVRSDGIKFSEGSFASARHFRFNEIKYILMALDHTLSFQVGNEVFSIPTDPNNKKHAEVISAFVSQVQLANPS